MSKLSVIIPVFNVKEYLLKCVNSVLNQTYKDLEILLIDDGSTDGSSDLCDKLEKKDKRIKVIHKDNGGLSDARNCGLKNSTGDYISFLDSDDFININSYQKMIQELEKHNLDVVVGNVQKYYNSNKITHSVKNKYKYTDRVMSGFEFMVEGIKTKSYTTVSVQGIYKRELIFDNNLFFEVDLLHEDELWTPQVFLSANRVKYIDIDYYMHFQRDGSITRRNNQTKNALDLIKICYKLEDFYKNVISSKHIRILNDRIVSLYLHAFVKGKLYDCGDFKLDYVFLSRNANSFKNILLILLLKLSTKHFLKLYHTRLQLD